MATQHVPGDVLEQMIEKSVAAKEWSYSPYSKFRVGASLLSQDGTIFTGCNVENVAHSPGVCAERTAVVKAVSEGHRRFTAVVISSDIDSFLYPCGVCRQTLSEFCDDMDVYVTKPDRTFLKLTLAELLPGPQAGIKDTLLN